LLIAAAVGCGKKSAEPKVTYVPDDDPRMNAAIEKARGSVQTFITALRSPKRTQSSFSVKMAFSDGKHQEHIWLSSVRYDGTKFHGTVDNKPEKITTIKLGDRVSVERSKISDWMYVENRTLVGGHTIRVLRDVMSPKEREEFDRTVPFLID